jgi:hypothetical protein
VRIVGRFVWGVPTCECAKLEDVEIVLEELPRRLPNRFEYGQKSKQDRHPLAAEKRLKWAERGDSSTAKRPKTAEDAGHAHKATGVSFYE